MKKLLASLLAAVLFAAPAYALEAPEEVFDYWYEGMAYLTEDIGPRSVGTQGEKDAYAWLVEQFESFGYSFDDGTLITSNCVPFLHYTGRTLQSPNLIAIKPALSSNPQIITVCAHYDSVDVAPGARDNASGIAATLALSQLFAQAEPFENTELRFIAFGAEETGHQGSLSYCYGLSEDERARSLAAFNIDILVSDMWESDVVFSLDTVGMRTPDGYVEGEPGRPAVNRAAQAMLAAMQEVGAFDPEEQEITWCGPRHLGDSDHDSFHYFGIDSVNICFRSTTETGGHWPSLMHTADDTLGDLDTNRSWEALSAVYTAVDSLARDHEYGME